MTDGIKGGFASFSNASPFKTDTTNSLFGNATPTANNTAGTTGTTNTPSPFGGGGNLFGNAGAKPGGIFGGGNVTTTTPGPPGGSLFGNFGQTAGNAATTSAQPSTPTPAATTTTMPALGLFGGKPSGQAGSTSTTPGTSTAGAGATPSFGLNSVTPATSSSTPQPSTTPATSSFFAQPPKPADSSSPAPTPAAGNTLFGLKKPDAPTSSATPSAPSLFGVPFGKKDDDASKDKEKPVASTTPAGNLFGQAPAAGTSGAGNTISPGTSPAFGAFGSKPAEQKDAVKEGEKKDGHVPLFGPSATKDTAAAPTAIPSGTTPSSAISVPPPSMLRGKTIEEIVNKWSSDLETHVKEFSRLASEIAVWDRALIDNGNTIAALFQHVLLAEREQNDIEQSLKHVEEQQKELSTTLEVYEKSAGEIFDGQGGGLRALDVGPADAERDKHYTLAADLNANLDDLSRSLMQMIDSVNSLSEGSRENAENGSKGDAPLEQIAQILSSHLESLQWIDSAVREVDTKVTDVEKRIREASAGNNAANSVSGAVHSHLQRPRGFGLR